jgi:DNA-binding transcriptional MerR regulator
VRIGELAARTGVSRRSLRYYEGHGLLDTARTDAGHRIYPPDAVDRVIRIQELMAAGLSVRTIGHLLPCVLAPPADRGPYLHSALLAHRRQLAAATADLERARDVLDALVEELVPDEARLRSLSPAAAQPPSP